MVTPNNSNTTVQQTGQPDQKEKTVKNNLQLWNRLKGFFHTSSYSRLLAAIGPFEKELETIHSIIGDNDDKTKQWYTNATENLQKSKDLLEIYNLQSAWKHFYSALCASTYLSKGENLRNIANTTLIESKKKLDGWRREAVINLLGDENGNLKEIKPNKEEAKVLNDKASDPNKTNVAPKQESSEKTASLFNNDLYVSLGILTEEYNNRYIKMDIAHKQLMLLMLSSAVLIPLAIFALVKSPATLEILNPFFLSSVVLFGAIGGTISGLVTVSRHSIKGKIPDQLLSSWSTMAKPVYGGIAALGISAFVFAGLVQVGGIASSSISIFFVLAISVLAGFSEHFLLGVLQDNDIQRTQKEIVNKLDEVTEKLKAVTSSEKTGAEKERKLA